MDMEKTGIALFDLPEQLVHCICQEWIDTIDLSSLDVAVSPSPQHRQCFQRLLAEPSFCTPGLLDCADERYLHWLCKRTVCVRALHIPDPSRLSLFDSLAMRFRHLRVLSIENLCISRHPGIFDELFSLPHLAELSLRYCHGPGSVLEENGAVVSTRIEKLDLLRCFDFSPEQIAALLRRAPNLSWLNLGDIVHFSGVVVQELLTKPRMQSLSLSGVRDINDNQLAQLLVAFTDLRYLDISSCAALTDAALRAIQDSSGASLTSLRISGNYSFSSSALREVISRLPVLRELDASELPLSSQTFLQLGSCCRELRELRIADCITFDDIALFHIAGCCTSLEVVDFSLCVCITDRGIIELVHCCSRLHTVLLTRCFRLSDQAIVNLASKCPFLRVLSLAGLNGLSDNCLMTLAERLDTLQELDISSCLHLNDWGLLAFLRVCSSLRRLNVSENIDITSWFVEKLMDLPVARRLRSLDISFCPQIGEQVVNDLRHRFPLLSVRQGLS